ncbi:capping protein-inhibiting regulator of actin dynamics isoform X1 [Ctenopharyngodon idella]|uniref:capping protein-inhibiting regulator of actin dynamics isoform X1 n=2 Tax=Ctenopharyngodon idella TaxID=7959 RepID=UPI002230A2FB|nr:capping protein-inhibiting regulator of actin dynamics isoform X1 [Ctenopharyngodon idella]
MFASIKAKRPAHDSLALHLRHQTHKNMDSSSGEMDKNGEEVTGRKKSRFKQLKTRFFGKLKKKESEGLIKQSQSASDITAPEGRREVYDSEDEISYPQCLSSRALSHDSIFFTDQTQSTEPTRVLSQENVHGKIKALQLKLQQQNLHLGPPPMLIPGKRTEDSGTTSEDDGLPCSPPETSFHERVMHGAVYKYPESQKHLSSLSLAGTGSEEEEQGDLFQPSSRPLSPVSKQPVISPTSASTTPTSGVDFSSPACYMARLDNSAARHRMSVKPRNQRASTRGNRVPTVSLSPRYRSESISDLDNVLSEEDDDETMTFNDTVHHRLSSSPTSDLKEKPTSPEPTVTTPAASEQNQEENPNRTEIHFLSQGAEILKSEQSPESEGRVTTNPLYLQPMSFGLTLSSSGPQSPLGLPESAQPSREIESLRAHSPILTHDTNDTQIQMSENLMCGTDTKESTQEDASFRLFPAPLPRITKPKMETRSPPSPKGAMEASTKPWEAGVESDRMQFFIASAKNHSKTTSETVTKQNEGHLKGAPGIKTQSNKPNLESQKDEARETKPTEFQSFLRQTQDKKSFRKEVTPPITSKPTTGTSLKKTDTATEHVETEKLEEPEDRKNTFGVQLRTTSLSLKYRSEVSKIKDETKRYSLESNTALAVSEDHSGKAETFRNMCDGNSKSKHSVPKKQDSQSLECQLAAQDSEYGKPSIQNTIGATKEAVSEPGWMSLAREKTRAYHPLLSRLATNHSPVHPSPLTAPPAQPPKPALQPKTQPLTTALHPLKTQHTLNTPIQPASQRLPTKPAPSGTKDKQDNGRNCTAEDDTIKKAGASNKMDGNAKSITPNTETLTATSEIPATSPPDVSQQPRSDGAQPSWMELAKRKSLAWSDKTLE